MTNRVTPATLSTQKELIGTLNSQSILLQLSYAQDKSISRIKQELMQQLFYVSQETALKAKFDFQTNCSNNLLDGKWNHAKPQQNGEEGEEDDEQSGYEEEVDDEMEEEQEDHIIEDEDVGHMEDDDEDDMHHHQPLSPSST